MAELGNLLNLNDNAAKVDVQVEMLDYDYVKNCDDTMKVHAILNVLKSGKEGYYPELIKFTEDRLLSLLPAQERKRYVSLNHKTTPQEISDAEIDLLKWQKEVGNMDSQLKTSKDITAANPSHRPIRGISHPSVETKSSSPVKPASANDGIKERVSYPKLSSSTKEVGVAVFKYTTYLNKSQRLKIESIRDSLNAYSLTETHRKHLANLEKIKGNESFRTGDNDDAVTCYSKSIALDDSNAIVYANRAMAYIRKELYEWAEDDSSISIMIDPSYTKAYTRRGMVRFKRGKYFEAALDFKQALLFDSNNAELLKLLKNSQDKYEEVEGKPFPDVPQNNSTNDDNKQFGSIQPIAVKHFNDLFPSFELQSAVTIVEGIADSSSSVTKSSNEGNYVRIVVESDDEDDEEEEEYQTSNHMTDNSSNFQRIAITDDDNDDDDEHENSDYVKIDQPPDDLSQNKVIENTSFRRVPIVDDDDEEEDLNSKEVKPEINPKSVADPDHSSKAEELKEQGNVLMKQGKFQEALDYYNKSLSYDPHHLASLNNRSQAYLSLRNYSAAISDCTIVLMSDPENIKALCRRANAYFFTQEMELSLADTQAILLLDSKNQIALKLLEKLKESALSNSTYHRNAKNPKIESDDNQASVSLSSSQVSSHNNNESSVEPIDIENIKQKSKQYLHDGKVDEVITLISPFINSGADATYQLSSLLPDDKQSILQLLASAYHSKQLHEQVVEVTSMILDTDNDNFKAKLRRAEAYIGILKKGRYLIDKIAILQSAKNDIQELLRIDNKNNNAIGLLDDLQSIYENDEEGFGYALKSIKPIEKSHQDITQDSPLDQLEMSKNDEKRLKSDELKEKGNKSMTSHDYIMAIDYYSQAINIDINNINVYNNRAMAYLKLLKFNEADKDASYVIKNNDNNEEETFKKSRLSKALYRRAQALIGQSKNNGDKNKIQAAYDDLLLLLKIDPNNKPAENELKRVKGLLDTSSNNNSSKKNNSSNNSFLAERSTRKKTDDNIIHSPVTVSSTAPSSPVSENISSNNTSINKKKSSPSSKLHDSLSTSTVAAANIISNNFQIPVEPPKTTYELERVWRGLKDKPAAFADYISSFKKSTFKKVFKETVSPDLISSMMISLCDHTSNKKSVIKSLEGFATISSFGLTLSLLPQQDLDVLKKIFDQLLNDNNNDNNDDNYAFRLNELKKLYRM
eukprot:gene10457-14045_t